MNPWQERERVVVNTVSESQPAPICADYPTCPKEERRLLNEVRAIEKNVSQNYKLSNGMRATDFCLEYIMRNHFKRKKT